jgi:hypothetical protein
MFGRENMTLVDYDGAIAAGKDIAFVILCDILGVFCDELPKVVQSKSNTRPEMIPYNLLSIVNDFVSVLGCEICSAKLPRGPHMMEFAQRFGSAKEIKIDEVKLAGLWPLSEQESRSYREEYGDKLLYSNHTAAMEAARELSIMELDEESFYESSGNVRWLRGEVVRLYGESYLCGCSLNARKMLQLLTMETTKSNIRARGKLSLPCKI